MTATTNEPASQPATKAPPLVQLENVGKHYGNITALQGINLQVRARRGDLRPRRQRRRQVDADQDRLRATRSTTRAILRVDGEETHFGSPRDALDKGIATVYQDLAVVP